MHMVLKLPQLCFLMQEFVETYGITEKQQFLQH